MRNTSWLHHCSLSHKPPAVTHKRNGETQKLSLGKCNAGSPHFCVTVSFCTSTRQDMYRKVPYFTGNYLMKIGGIHDITLQALISPVYAKSFIQCFVKTLQLAQDLPVMNRTLIWATQPSRSLQNKYMYDQQQLLNSIPTSLKGSSLSPFLQKDFSEICENASPPSLFPSQNQELVHGATLDVSYCYGLNSEASNTR